MAITCQLCYYINTKFTYEGGRKMKYWMKEAARRVRRWIAIGLCLVFFVECLKPLSAKTDSDEAAGAHVNLLQENEGAYAEEFSMLDIYMEEEDGRYHFRLEYELKANEREETGTPDDEDSPDDTDQGSQKPGEGGEGQVSSGDTRPAQAEEPVSGAAVSEVTVKQEPMFSSLSGGDVQIVEQTTKTIEAIVDFSRVFMVGDQPAAGEVAGVAGQPVGTYALSALEDRIRLAASMTVPEYREAGYSGSMNFTLQAAEGAAGAGLIWDKEKGVLTLEATERDLTPYLRDM